MSFHLGTARAADTTDPADARSRTAAAGTTTATAATALH